MLDKGVCKVARLPRQSILARLQTFRENTTKTKRHTKLDCHVRAFLHTCLQSLLLREKKKNTDNTDNTEKCRKEKKHSTQDCHVRACLQSFYREKGKRNTENSEKTERHTQQDYDVRAF